VRLRGGRSEWTGPVLRRRRGPQEAGCRALNVAVLTDRFPELSETFVVSEIKALGALGHAVRVEAGGAADTPNPDAGGIDVAYLTHDGPRRQLLDLARLAARHPLRCLADVFERRRWRREERVRPLRGLAPAARRLRSGGAEHLHAHFAAGAALDALRLARILGLPYSVTAHAYDIYLEPRNLREKLEHAAFVTSGCEYTVRDLEKIAPAAQVHEVIMGVDGQRFARTRPHPAGRAVVAVGRLVEKKGFAYLIEAAALLRERTALDRVTIVGEGPLRAQLQTRVRELALEDTVELPGDSSPDSVRELLETADVLAMPCVVARNGDRDSMPVVVKEALAMEVPVVASDEVGLPELVRPEFGRLVPPGEPDRLAAAIEELLALAPERRAAMGRAGRAFVLERCDVRRETERLARLIEAAI
jgi:glycosyltransferase involved in cell wall biosynthesis